MNYDVEDLAKQLYLVNYKYCGIPQNDIDLWNDVNINDMLNKIENNLLIYEIE